MIGASRPTISRNEIIEKVSEADIIGYYLGITSIPTLINSPFRHDENPSFALYSPNGKDVNYKDYATNEGGGCMALLMKLWNLILIIISSSLTMQKYAINLESLMKQRNISIL